MTLLQAIVLGIVQGLTEFLPISSTAHLRLAPALLGWSDPGAAFSAVIQLGTLLAVLIYFGRDIGRIGSATARSLFDAEVRSSVPARQGWMIVVGTVPIVVCGLLLKHQIETTLRSLYVICAALIALAILLAVAEGVVSYRRRLNQPFRTIDGITWFDALTMGVAQALALIPGVSRSGITISAGLFSGMSREAAARFSFLLSLPAVFAAALLELVKERQSLLESQESAGLLLMATLVAFITGYASIAFLLHFLRRHSTWPFIVYRIALGSAVLGLLASGYLSP